MSVVRFDLVMKPYKFNTFVGSTAPINRFRVFSITYDIGEVISAISPLLKTIK